MIFQTEKQLKEFGDKLPADKKGQIEQALSRLKEAHKSQDVASIETATEELTKVWQAASEDLYKNAQGANPQGEQTNTNTSSTSSEKDKEVTDVDFEEVK